MSDFPHHRVEDTATTPQDVVACVVESLGAMLHGDPGSQYVPGIASVRPGSDGPSWSLVLETGDGARFKITVEALA